MAKKNQIQKVERVVGFAGSISSILGLLIAIPAFFAGLAIGKKEEKK